MPHIHEKIDFTVEVFVVHGDRVLLRKHDKYKKWLSVGGHIELDEDPNEAAVREVLEEVGLAITLHGDAPSFREHAEYRELIPPVAMNRHRIGPTHEHVTLVYFATTDDPSLRLSDTEVTDDCRWFSREDLGSVELSDSIRHYALRALETVGSG